MQLGFIGLGKMGMNMVKRLSGGGHTVFGTARTATRKPELEQAGGRWVENLADFARVLSAPRTVWVMVPAGQATEDTIQGLTHVLSPGDTIIDGGNSDYRDTQRRAEDLSRLGFRFIDSGTSGGIWGLKNGYCLMIGGLARDVQAAGPLFETLAPPSGWAHVGPSGAGHMVKMVHNAIEYGMMQAMAEGFDVLDHSGLNLDLARIAELWNHGSVVRSWLMELAAGVFAEDPKIEAIQGYVEDSGECRWTIETALQQGTPTPVFCASLHARYASRRENAFANRFLAALRQKFGGHAVKAAPTQE